MARKASELTIKYDPPGNVRLSELRQLCANLAACLNHIAETSLRTGTAPDFDIAELKGGSVGIALRPERKRFDDGALVIGRFKKFTRSIREDTANGEIDDVGLTLFRKLFLPVTREGSKMIVDGQSLTTQFIANIDKRLVRPVRAFGTIKGRLDRINVHDASEFHIYPPIREKGIRCRFPDSLTEKVGVAVKRNVVVTGQMLYFPGEAFPRLINVESISDPIPPDSELPRLGDLRGIAPNCTGELSTLNYLGAIANE